MNNNKLISWRVRSFPTLMDLHNPYIFGGVKCVINVSEKTNESLCRYYLENDIRYYHLPLLENVADMGLENILKAVKILVANHTDGVRTIVHCIGGNNRSRLVSECAHFALFGEHLKDEYFGYMNHICFNIEKGYLPVKINELEKLLNQL